MAERKNSPIVCVGLRVQWLNEWTSTSEWWQSVRYLNLSVSSVHSVKLVMLSMKIAAEMFLTGGHYSIWIILTEFRSQAFLIPLLKLLADEQTGKKTYKQIGINIRGEKLIYFWEIYSRLVKSKMRILGNIQSLQKWKYLERETMSEKRSITWTAKCKLPKSTDRETFRKLLPLQQKLLQFLEFAVTNLSLFAVCQSYYSFPQRSYTIALENANLRRAAFH